MPLVASFLGIKIYMYFEDHEPPHFHAEKAEFEMVVEIETSRIMKGSLPRTELALVIEWASQHRSELADNWGRARQGRPLRRIE